MRFNDKASDKELIASSKEGCRAAFDILVDKYKDKIENSIMYYSHSKFDTEDIVQETFIKAFTKLNQYKEDTSFGAWLNSIAKNTFIDLTRKQQLNQDVDISEDKMNNILEETEDGWEVKELKLSAIEKSIENLTDEYRKVLEMKFYHNLSYEKISQELNVPLGTIKTWVHRAKLELKKEHNRE